MRVVWIVLTVCVLKCSAMSRRELEEFSDYIFSTSQLDLNVKKGTTPDDDLFDDDEAVSDHAWEDSGKFEGDLILNDRQRRLIVENVEGLSRNGLTDSTKRWPHNELIYFIQREHFNSDQIESIERGIEDLAQASCVKFRPYRKGDRDAVVIQGSRRGCFAQVGYQGGFQVLNLSGRHPAGRGCFRHGTVVHEMLHTLGFFHMQSSPDRDDYITVKWENILQPTRHNFRKYNSFSVSDFGVGYDYDSVLHYSRRAFSANGKDTLVPKQSGVSIGQRIGLSDKDTQKLNKMYCDANSNNLEFDDGSSTQKPKKKKKPKNQPFDGLGIGYQKGKTVVIKLPATEDGKLPDIALIEPMNYFSKPQPQTVPSQEVSLYGGSEYPYSPEKPELEPVKNIDDYDEFEPGRGYPKSDTTKHETFADAYDKLAKKVYADSKDYPYKINKDYSEYYNPSKGPDRITDWNEKYENNVPPHKQARKPVRLIHNQNQGLERNESPAKFEDTDSTYGTSLPFKNIYTPYQLPESPKFASKNQKDRQSYHNFYAPRMNKKIQSDTLFPTAAGALFENTRKNNPDSYNGFSENVMEHKRDGYLRPSDNYDPEEKKNQEYTSENKYSSEDSKETPNSSHVFDEYDGSSVFDSPAPSTGSWYKPVYSNIEAVTRHYSGDISIPHEDT